METNFKTICFWFHKQILSNQECVLPLFFLFSFFGLQANSLDSVSDLSSEMQITQVEGIVQDEWGTPLVGANILEKGTSNGVQSDFNGNFVLDVQDENAILVVSYVGFITQEIEVSTAQSMTIVLYEDAASLADVVVVGYGTQKRENLTGAVGVVTAEEMNDRPVISAAQAIQGVDPSLNLTFGTGVADSGYSVNIRGVASINGGTPLVLADGVEIRLSEINPNDIESISVLKDMSSASIYGAKASAGVILITTKSGKSHQGFGKVTYSGRLGISQNTTSTDFITTGYDHVRLNNLFYEVYRGNQMAMYNEQEMQMLYERRNDVAEHPDRPWVLVDDAGRYKYYGNFDWYNYFFKKNRPESEHNVAFNGGNEQVQYYGSFRNIKQYGMFDIYEDNLESNSFRIKLDAKIKPWLRYSGNVSNIDYSYKYGGYHNEQATFRFLQSNIFSTFVPRNPDGSIVQYTNQLSSGSPLASGHAGFLTANDARNSRDRKTTVITNQIDLDLTRDLVLTGSYAVKNEQRLFKYRNMPFDYSRELGVYETYTAGSIYDYYQEGHVKATNNNVNIYATYTSDWSNNHNFKAVAGMQYEDYHYNNVVVKQNDLLSNNLESFSVATGAMEINQNLTAFKTLGYFGRLNYDYKGKYLLELSGRFDGTSRFAEGQRWGFFPSGSLGWRMSEESFWDNLKPVISDSKLRASYGSLGNQQVNNYAYIEQISTGNRMSYTFDGTSQANYASVSNPISSSLTWETVSMYNIGLDLAFFRNQLYLTGDYYVRNTMDMLAPSLTLPSVYGANTPTSNSADLRTNGWELDLSWRDHLTLGGDTFNYNIGVAVGDYVTKITKFNNPNKLLSDYYVGQTLGEIWGYKVAGLFETDEAAADYQSRIDDRAVNNRVYNSKNDNMLLAGDVEFIDLNGDGIVNGGSGTVDDPGDRRVIGNSLPRYSYSFRLGADWRGFEISAFFQGVAKQDWWPTAYAYDFWGPYSFPSLSFIHEDFESNVWTPDNQDAYFPRARGYASYSSGALGTTNDRYLQDVSYLRLKNLTLGYTLPLSVKGIESVKVFATGENLFYWSALKRYTTTVDPELTNTGSTYDSNSGVGYGYSKSMSLGVKIVL